MSDDSDMDEPSPEALRRYQSMRRHTVGMTDPRFVIWSVKKPVWTFCESDCIFRTEIPDDLRARLECTARQRQHLPQIVNISDVANAQRMYIDCTCQK